MSLLRFIKREEDDVKKLIKKIAAKAATGAKLLEEFARHDASIRLDETGDAFELSLLLAQAQALSYAGHLAKVAGENESQPERARALASLSEDMANRYHEVFALRLSKTKWFPGRVTPHRKRCRRNLTSANPPNAGTFLPSHRRRNKTNQRKTS